jgi:Mg2+ and Co2+ transporter CorA
VVSRAQVKRSPQPGVPSVCSKELRDRAVELERAIDLVTLEARDAIDFITAQKAEAQAAVSLELAREGHKLNVITAVFLPITALASVFSMTLRSGLETWGEPWVFWGVVAAGVALALFMRSRLSTPAPPTPPKKQAVEALAWITSPVAE